MNVAVHPIRRLIGTLEVPGDKSISHRAALIGALASGPTEVSGFLEAEDCLHTLRAIAALGVEVTRKGPGQYRIGGAGLDGLQEPDRVLECGNSGTSARLLLGCLAGQPFWSILTGDDSLRRRPMERVTLPLREMGATVVGRQDGSRLPLAIRGRRPLRGGHHRLAMASAQVKSALLLAGLAADGPVTVEEPHPSRDHTERMLSRFGARLDCDGSRVTVSPGNRLTGQPVQVPGDFSSAAFFLLLGCLLPESELTIRGVGINPTRTGLLDVLREMGASVRLTAEADDGEPTATLHASTSRLTGTRVGGALIPRLIDELPILAVAATLAEGVTEVRDARELRVKESDRIVTLASELSRLGVRLEEREDGFRIRGGTRLRGARVRSHGDHRIAMALIVAGLMADGPTVVEDTACIATSFPEFVPTLQGLTDNQCVTVEENR
jgi:3-phosphoshikimate 1-carboxyvinyltransferase